jgi:hypothetical protein
MRRTGGAVVGVGGLAQDAAAQHGGGRVQGIGGGPGSVGGGSGIRPGQVADLRRGVGGGEGDVLPERIALPGGQVQMRAAGPGPLRGPPLPQLGPAQVCCEFPAAVPDWIAVLGGVAGERDRAPGDLAGVARAEPCANQEAGLVQAMEELALAACRRGSGDDLPSQRDPGCFVQPTAGCLLVLGAGRAAGGGAVGRCGRAQPVALLGDLAEASRSRLASGPLCLCGPR